MVKKVLHNLRALGKKPWAIRAACVPAVLILLVILIPLPRRLSIAPSQVMRYADGSPAHVFLSPDDKWRVPVVLENVDPRYRTRLLRFEDKRFRYHPGVDPIALVRAAWGNLRAGGVRSGASTITMQLVRILEPRPRNLFSKGIEALRAFQLELRLSKDEILAAYLQYLPFGRNIEGLESACHTFYGHNASALSEGEIAYLLAVPQNPAAYHPHQDNKKKIQAALGRIAARLHGNGAVSSKEKDAIRAFRFPQQYRAFQREAPHAAYWLKSGHAAGAAPSTLKKDIQQISRTTLNAYRGRYHARGIRNGAVVVIENSTMAVRALVGNFDFWDTRNQGQVAGFIAPRSPGSTLKPFIYAAAIDQALALPSHLVQDIPVRFGSYSPRNFEYTYHGLISLENALSQSLNIPFVELTRRIGVENLVDHFRPVFSTISDDPGYYGLSVAIGGMEVKLLELTHLYTIFSRGGCLDQYRTSTAAEKPRAEYRLISAESAFLTRRALSLRDRPDFPRHRATVQMPPDIFWKTGTSQGKKDAWSVGGNDYYTVGVWVGNFDAEPSIDLEGARSAAPILFDILTALSNRKYVKSHFPAYPKKLEDIAVCSFSGCIPNRHCPETKQQPVLVDNIPPQKCPYHTKYYIDTKTGYRLPPTSRFGKEYTEEVFTVIPAEVRTWYKENSQDLVEPPPLHPDYKYAENTTAPRILHPQAHTTFVIMPNRKQEDQEIPLQARCHVNERYIYWYVDGKLYKKTNAAERVWLKPEPGKHRVRAVNESGKYDEVIFKVIKPI